jgi:hypothetical protein
MSAPASLIPVPPPMPPRPVFRPVPAPPATPVAALEALLRNERTVDGYNARLFFGKFEHVHGVRLTPSQMTEEQVSYVLWTIQTGGYDAVLSVAEHGFDADMMTASRIERDESYHADARKAFVEEFVRAGHVQLLQCAGAQNVSDTLTESLPQSDFEKRRDSMM